MRIRPQPEQGPSNFFLKREVKESATPSKSGQKKGYRRISRAEFESVVCRRKRVGRLRGILNKKQMDGAGGHQAGA